MRLFCPLCGTRTDGRERLGAYCPGRQCGTDLRAGAGAVVQAWCEPERQRGQAGRTATVRLVVRNAGTRPDTYRVEPVEQVPGRLDFAASELNGPLAPGGMRIVEVRYTLPRDHVARGLDIASRFGVPGAEAADRVADGHGARFGVALRVVSTTANAGAAVAAFAVDVPGRLRRERETRQDGNAARGRGRSVPVLVGGAVLALILAAAGVAAVAANEGDDGSEGGSGGGSIAIPAPIVPGSGDTSAGTGTSNAANAGNGGTNSGNNGSNAGTNTGNGGKAGGNSGTNAGNSGTNAGNGGKAGGNSGTNSGNTGTNSGSGSGTTKFAVVPDIVGLDPDAAEKKIKDAGLVVTDIEFALNSGGPELQVMSVTPKAGTQVEKGSGLFVRMRDGKVEMPEVVGKDVATATAKLQDVGLKAATVTQYDDTKALGVVLKADYTAGQSVGLGKTVTLTYNAKPKLY